MKKIQGTLSGIGEKHRKDKWEYESFDKGSRNG
jgi:hypothetical protein